MEKSVVMPGDDHQGHRDPRRLTIKELRAICQSTAPAPERETFTGKRARFFSIYLTRFFLRTDITPNQITFLSVLVFLIGVSLFLTEAVGWSVLGSALVFFATVLDGCDGETARFRKMKSPVGGVYSEPVSHDVQYGLMFVPLGLAATWSTGSLWPLFFAFLASVSKLMTRLLEARYWALVTVKPKTQEELLATRRSYSERPAWKRFLSWVKRNVLSSNGMILPLFLAALFMKVDWYVYFYGVSYSLLWLFTFVRQLKALPSQSEQASPPVPGSAD